MGYVAIESIKSGEECVTALMQRASVVVRIEEGS
jgi:hypothetical protein